MKAKLIFNLPEDNEEFLRAVKATDMALVMWDIVFNMKKGILNSFDDMSENITYTNGAIDAINKIYERINELLEDHNINIDDLIS